MKEIGRCQWRSCIASRFGAIRSLVQIDPFLKELLYYINRRFYNLIFVPRYYNAKGGSRLSSDLNILFMATSTSISSAII